MSKKNIEMQVLGTDGNYESIYPVPAGHKESHISGDDRITPADIGAQEAITGTEGQTVVIGSNGKPTVANGVGAVVEQHHNLPQKFWRGTQAEYDAIETKDENTMYIITDASGEPIQSGDMLKSVYDTKNRNTDIFKYVDEHATNIPITSTPSKTDTIWIDPSEEGDGGGTSIPASDTEPETGNYWLDTSAEGGTYYTAGETLTDVTKSMYGLKSTATPNDVFAKLAMPHGYYGFDVTTVFSDGTPVPFVVLNGLQDISGNTATTDENGRCSVSMSDSKTPTVTISNYIGVANTETTISAEDGVIFIPVTITLERDTSMHLIRESQELKVLTGVPVDMCLVGGGASGRVETSRDTGSYPGGGGGYVTNLIGVILNDPKVTLTIGAGGSGGFVDNYNAGGDTSIEYNGIMATAEGAKSNVGNGSSSAGNNGQDGTTHVFNDGLLPVPGGSGGGGLCHSTSDNTTHTSGGLDFGGVGGFANGQAMSGNGGNGTGPGGGGGGGARVSNNAIASAGSGASGGLYIRVNAPEVSV